MFYAHVCFGIAPLWTYRFYESMQFTVNLSLGCLYFLSYSHSQQKSRDSGRWESRTLDILSIIVRNMRDEEV